LDVKNRNTFDKRNESGEKCFPVLAPLLISTGRRRRQKKRKDFQFFYFPFEYKIKTGTDSSRNDVDSSSRQVGKKIKKNIKKRCERQVRVTNTGALKNPVDVHLTFELFFCGYRIRKRGFCVAKGTRTTLWRTHK
jgi:hypothetical protein